MDFNVHNMRRLILNPTERRNSSIVPSNIPSKTEQEAAAVKRKTQTLHFGKFAKCSLPSSPIHHSDQDHEQVHRKKI